MAPILENTPAEAIPLLKKWIGGGRMPSFASPAHLWRRNPWNNSIIADSFLQDHGLSGGLTTNVDSAGTTRLCVLRSSPGAASCGGADIFRPTSNARVAASLWAGRNCRAQLFPARRARRNERSATARQVFPRLDHPPCTRAQSGIARESHLPSNCRSRGSPPARGAAL